MNELIDKCLYNWLGYGNYNGKLWFIGTEEGGAEIWREGIATLTLTESLKKRSEFFLSCGFHDVWENTYGIPLNCFKGITTWHFMSAFLLAIENKKVDAESIKNFLFIQKSLGALDSNHFLCELLPLPKRSELDFPYTDRWESLQEYLNEVTDKRFSMITDLIEKSHGVKLIIVYDNKTQAFISDKWGNKFDHSIEFEFIKDNKRPQKYTLHHSEIAGKEILFLYTPFFGNGLISYEGIREAVHTLGLKSYLYK